MAALEIFQQFWSAHELGIDTYLSGIFLYAIHKRQNKKPFSMLAAVNIAVGPKAKRLVVTLDVLVTAAFGSYLVFKLTNPTTEPQAIIAGLGMTGILPSLTKNRL